MSRCRKSSCAGSSVTSRTPASRKAWNRERICCDCGRIEHVRKDNKSLRCVSCSSRRNASSPAAKASAAAKRTAVTCTCLNCSSTFERTPSQVARGRNKYCSKICDNAHSQVQRTCKCCGASFTVGKSRVNGSNNSSGNFCSRPCYEKWLCRAERTTGRGSRWKSISQAEVEKAPFCGWCGSPKKRLQVHHIVPFRLTNNNDSSNLIPLCASCHKRVELMTVEIEATGISPEEMAPVLMLFLRQRQNATKEILKRLIRERST